MHILYSHLRLIIEKEIDVQRVEVAISTLDLTVELFIGCFHLNILERHPKMLHNESRDEENSVCYGQLLEVDNNSQFIRNRKLLKI